MDPVDSICLAAALHAAVLAVSAYCVRPLGDTDVETREETTHVFWVRTLPDAEREEEDPAPQEAAQGTPEGRQHTDCRCGKDRGGSMGERTAARAGKRYGVQGPSDNPDPHIARAPGESWEPETRPLIGLTPPPPSGDPHAPIAPWGRDDTLGNDPDSARGNMWGEDIGASFGVGGLGGADAESSCVSCGADPGRHTRVPLDTAEGGPTDTARAR